MEKIKKYVTKFKAKEVEERLQTIDFLVNHKTDITHDYTDSIDKEKVPSMAALNTLKLYMDNQFETITGSGETAFKFTQSYVDKVDRSTGNFRGVFATVSIRDKAHPDEAILELGDACVVLNLDGNTVDQRWTGVEWGNYSTQPAIISGISLVGGTSSDVVIYDTKVNKSCKLVIRVVDASTHESHIAEIIMSSNKNIGTTSTIVNSSAYAEVFTNTDLFDHITEKMVDDNAVLEIQTNSSCTLTIDIVSLI